MFRKFNLLKNIKDMDDYRLSRLSRLFIEEIKYLVIRHFRSKVTKILNLFSLFFFLVSSCYATQKWNFPQFLFIIGTYNFYSLELYFIPTKAKQLFYNILLVI